MRMRLFSAHASAALVATLILCCTAARADRDDNENNGDLQPTLEEMARKVIVKRWPDAKNIEVNDADDDDDDGGKMADNDADKDDNAETDTKKPAEDVAADDDDAGLDADEPATWTLSVTFESGGTNFEALMDDDGKIQYVYEEVPVKNAPKTIVDAARANIANGDVLYVDKILDETKDTPAVLYAVGIGSKEVQLDPDGKLIRIDDVEDPDEPAEKPEPGQRTAEQTITI